MAGVRRLDVREGGTGLPDGATLGGGHLDAREEGGEEGPWSGGHRSPADNAGSLGVRKGGRWAGALGPLSHLAVGELCAGRPLAQG